MTSWDPVHPILPTDLRLVDAPFPVVVEPGTVWADLTFTGVRLGSGGSAKDGVYLANDASMGRMVAIKRVPIEDKGSSWFPHLGMGLDCFKAKKESAVAALMGEHERIMKIFKTYTDGRSAVFVCEYIPGCRTWYDWVPWAAEQVGTQKMSKGNAQKLVAGVLLQLLGSLLPSGDTLVEGYTPCYSSPEILSADLSEDTILGTAADMYSFGATVHNTFATLAKGTRNAKLGFTSIGWETVITRDDQGCVHLDARLWSPSKYHDAFQPHLARLLSQDPTKRPSAEEIWNSEEI
ncbi:hypothetical protein HDU93_002398, partial [Gonapodya sp. JEL0774]